MPVCVVLLFLAAFAVRIESRSLMSVFLLGLLAGITYFIYKLTRIYADATEQDYRTVRLTLTFFSVFSIVSARGGGCGCGCR